MAVTKSTKHSSDGKLIQGDSPTSHLSWEVKQWLLKWWCSVGYLLVLVFHHYYSCFGAFCYCHSYFILVLSGEPTVDDHLPSSVKSMPCDWFSVRHLEELSDGTENQPMHGSLYRKSILSVAGIASLFSDCECKMLIMFHLCLPLVSLSLPLASVWTNPFTMYSRTDHTAVLILTPTGSTTRSTKASVTHWSLNWNKVLPTLFSTDCKRESYDF